ncbi:MAG: hypothetical protein IT381_10465 [Deltaproteobacteria bacterium]|nr:hypothetical protein [Deltaproteobacteria bacterium]
MKSVMMTHDDVVKMLANTRARTRTEAAAEALKRFTPQVSGFALEPTWEELPEIDVTAAPLVPARSQTFCSTPAATREPVIAPAGQPPAAKPKKKRQPKTFDGTPLWNRKQAARYLHHSESWLAHHKNPPRETRLEEGGQVFYTKAALDAFIAERTK